MRCILYCQPGGNSPQHKSDITCTQTAFFHRRQNSFDRSGVNTINLINRLKLNAGRLTIEINGRWIREKSFRRKYPLDDLVEEVGKGLPEDGHWRIAALFDPKKGSAEFNIMRSFRGSDE